jgi:alpha-2-macroglobulin
VFLDGMPIKLGANAEIPLTAAQIANGFDIRHNGDELNLVAEIVGARSSVNSIDNGYIVTKTWYDRDGLPIDIGTSNIAGGGLISAKQGDLFTVVVEIDRSKKTEQGDLLLTDLLPSGFEIEKGIVATPTFSDETGNRYALDFENARVPTFEQSMDDRFIAHFQDRWNTKDYGMLRYTVRAAYDTQAVVPDAHVEHMYAPEISGRSSAASVIVAPK